MHITKCPENEWNFSPIYLQNMIIHEYWLQLMYEIQEIFIDGYSFDSIKQLS